jgi:ubiquinone/menaquinone biosynthesis C-methylase UbiE
VTESGWQGDRYDAAASHHRVLDDWFLDRQPPRPSDTVVDAGCGSGEFTARVAELVPDGRVIGVEPDASMLEQAQTKARENLEFRRGRLQELDTVCDPESVDLVVSRAVFHWLPLDEYPRCYDAIFRVLKAGGWLHAESGGTGNVHLVKDFLDEVAAGHGLDTAAVMFPDAGTVLELVEDVGFTVPSGGVSTVAQRRVFDRDALRSFLQTQATMAYAANAGAAAFDAFRAEADRRVDELRRNDGTYDQTFVRLDVLCQRPGSEILKS